jgi:putative membrane protein
MSYLDDPRVYFAAERTLLAWIRTGITTIGLGFVVAKFGLFLRFLAPHDAIPVHKQGISLLIGLVLVVLGAATCLGAAVQFQRFVRTLSPQELPPRWASSFAGWIAYGMALSGLGLAIYLVL